MTVRADAYQRSDAARKHVEPKQQQMAPEHPGFSVRNAAVKIWIHQGSTGQTCVVAPDFSGSGHSFVPLVDRWATSQCHLQWAQWVFEQFLGTWKKQLRLSLSVCSPLVFCWELDPTAHHSAGGTDTAPKWFHGFPLVFLLQGWGAERGPLLSSKVGESRAGKDFWKHVGHDNTTLNVE